MPTTDGRPCFLAQQLLHVCRRAQPAVRARKKKTSNGMSTRSGSDTKAVQLQGCCTQHTAHACCCPCHRDHRRAYFLESAVIPLSKQNMKKNTPPNTAAAFGGGGERGVSRRQARQRFVYRHLAMARASHLLSPPSSHSSRVVPVGDSTPALTLTLKCRSPLFGLFSCFFGRFTGTSLRHAQAGRPLHGVVQTVISKKL